MTPDQYTVVGRAAPALFAEALRRFGKVTFRAAGHSMLPAIPPGQLVRLVHATIEDVQPGDVIVYVERGRLVAHRLVRKTQRGRAIVTRGDAHLACDRPVPAIQLLGRVVDVRPCTTGDRLRGIALRLRIHLAKRIASTAARLWAQISPAAAL